MNVIRVIRERNLIRIFRRRSSGANRNDNTSASTFIPFGAAALCNAYNVHLYYYYSTIQNTYDIHNLE